MVALLQTGVFNPLSFRHAARLLLIAVLLCFVSTQSIAATVKPGITITSDTQDVYLGDTVVIEVESVGILDTLDISPLFRHADLIRETTGTRISVVNDRVVDVKLRRMEFLPKQEGRLLLGPLSGESIQGSHVSNTLVINVAPAIDTQWQPEASDLSINIILSNAQQTIDLSSSTDEFSTYVGQHIMADIKLRHYHPIAEENLILPGFDGFDVLPEYEERRTIEHRAEQSVRLISWRFHLFAQRSGTIEIDPVIWNGTEIKSRTQRSSFSRQHNPTSLTINPAREGADWWLPATNVALTESWSKDARELTAGDEILRTITLEATNVLANHLPLVEPYESRAISSTLISQNRQQQLIGQQINATAKFTYRMVAQSPIPVFLDTVRVPWFDTKNSLEQEAILPARRINVGLPDRADLLAELASNDQWSRSIGLKIQSLAGNFAFWHLSLIMLLLILVGLVAFELRRFFTKPDKRYRSATDNCLPEL